MTNIPEQASRSLRKPASCKTRFAFDPGWLPDGSRAPCGELRCAAARSAAPSIPIVVVLGARCGPAVRGLLVLELFEVRPCACRDTFGGICRLLILGDVESGPSRKLAFLVALAWVIAATVIHHHSRTGLGALPRFIQHATTLIDEEQYDDAIRLVEHEVGLIANAGSASTTGSQTSDQLRTLRLPISPAFRGRSGSPARLGQNGLSSRSTGWPISCRRTSAPSRWRLILL